MLESGKSGWVSFEVKETRRNGRAKEEWWLANRLNPKTSLCLFVQNHKLHKILLSVFSWWKLTKEAFSVKMR